MSRKLKDSGVPWIGQVPEGWKVERLPFQFSFSKGLNITKADLVEEGIAVISYGQIHAKHNNGVHLQPSLLRFVPESVADADGSARLKFGDIVFADTSEDLDGAGNCVLVDTREEVFAGYHTLVARPNQADFARYFAYLFQSPNWRSQLRSTVNGVKVFSITQRVLRGTTILVPPLPEQKAIAEFLDGKCAEIDGLREKIEKQIATLEEYKKSLITESVTRGLDPNAPMKDSGVPWIGQVPAKWEIKRFRYVASEILKGNGIKKDEVVENGDTPCVRYGEIYTKYNQSFRECSSRTNVSLVPLQRFASTGDILFAGTGESVEEIGKNIAYLGDEKILVGGDIVLARHDQNAGFLSYALNSAYSQRQKSSGKSKLKVVHISTDDIKNIVLLVPPLPEQKAIAEFLDGKCAEIDAETEKCRGMLERLEEYKKALIFECVTGKKEVV